MASAFLGYARWLWAAGGLALLGACSAPDQPATSSLPPPVGHYEGAVSLPGTGARVGLELRKNTSGQLQAELTLLGSSATTVPLGTVWYRAPQLQLEQTGGFPGHVSISALQEGDFLRGVLQLDSLRGEFVLVRRGAAAPRPWREVSVRLPGLAKPQQATFYVPNDTLARHPVIVAWAAANPANLDHVLRLGQEGVATLLLSAPVAPSDSVVARATGAALRWLRHRPEADTTRLGVWGREATAPEVAVAACQAAAKFVLLENAEIQDEAASQPFRALGRARIPVFGFYAGRDTTQNVPESRRRMRQALGRQGMQVRTFAAAGPGFYLPGRPAADGRWQWPKATPGLWEEVARWLRQLK